MDFGELLFGAATLYADDVAQVFVARRYGGIDSEESAEVDLTDGLDREAFKGDSAHRALRHVSHHHAGVERCQQVFLWIGEPVRSANFDRFVDIDREPARHPLAADLESLDWRAAPCLALPGRGNAPVCLAFSGVPLDVIDKSKQVVDIDTVDDVGLGGLRLGKHDRSPFAWVAGVHIG